MSFDRDELIAACRAYGPVVRVVVAKVRGSAPRDAGTAMLVWQNGQTGTIGGGTLEFELTQAARELMAQGDDRLSQHALGPDMGQCCGGHVLMLSEVFDLKRASGLPENLVARGPDPMPLSVSRVLAQHRNGTAPMSAQFLDGWMIEPVASPTRQIWIWGAGHVGRAMVRVLNPLPDLAVTWIDTGADRFPADIPEDVTVLQGGDPALLVRHAPQTAEHLIVTYSHALDLALCHGLLTQGFRFCGLIGSATKKARFFKRLAEAGHNSQQIDRITCPIGDPGLGKHPHQIALGVAAQLLHPAQDTFYGKERRA